MKAIKLTDSVYWVGGVDYASRSFHGYNTNRGATYNAYLIIDDKITLIDTVKAAFSKEMLERIASVIDTSKIDYIISNHSEFDHSGAIREVAELAPNAEIIATTAGVKFLTNMYGNLNYRVVKAGESLNTGKYTFTFLPTPMVHWPDNMTTYLNEQQILFSNDAFGQHIATNTRFDTDTHFDTVMDEAVKYYANIVMPYAMQTSKALAAVKDLKLKVIAPSHGIVWTKHIDDILNLYQKLTSGDKDDCAVVVYDTMWGNTEKMAKDIGAALEQKYSSVVYFDLRVDHISDVVKYIATAKVVALGSPTQNNTFMPNVAALLNYIKGLNPPKFNFITFGSFGWAGGAVKHMTEALTTLGHNKLTEISANLAPSTLDLTELLSSL